MSHLIARQLGHITRAQLLALGVTPAWIRSRIRRGWLIPVHAGVYAVGHVPRHAHARAMAAVLACGEGAALSHAAAAALWGAREWPAVLEVVSAAEHRRPGIWTHRSSTLTRHAIGRRHGIPVTSPGRTVIDLQPRLGDAGLVRLVNELRLAGHLRPAALTELLEASSRVRALLTDGDGRGAALTRSALEDLFRAFVLRHGLPMPELTVRIPELGREVDALYRAARLIIEVDSWKFHGDRTSFERDRAKDAVALALGYRTLRITRRRMTTGGEQEAETIHRILAS